jgi:hypothetical protein
VPAKKTKKTTPAKKAASKGPKKARPCKDKNVCDYLEYELSPYLNDDLWPDIRRLLRAVCNLESIIIDGKPNDVSRRICTGGGTDEPADPPKPPQW